MNTEPQIKRYMQRVSRNDACEAGKAIAPLVYKHLSTQTSAITLAALMIAAGRAALESKATIMEGFLRDGRFYQVVNGKPYMVESEDELNAQWQEIV